MGELKAILVGLQVIVSKKWENTIVCSDSQQAINTILDDTGIKDDNYLIVNQCRDLMKKVDGLKLEFEGRNGNRVANRCARHCRNVDYVTNFVNLWDTSLDCLADVIWEDKPP